MKINKIVSKIKPVLKIIALAIMTAIFFVLVFIALPWTERVPGTFRFDLNIQKDSYWSKTYEIELLVKKQDESQATLKVEQTKNIIERRLRKLGVEEVTIIDIDEPLTEIDATGEILNADSEEENVDEIEGLDINLDTGLDTSTEESDETEVVQEDDGYIHKYISVSVRTQRNADVVDLLISQRGFLRILTVKDGVEFTDEEGDITPYLQDNYDKTEFTRHSFRTIYIKDELTDDYGVVYFGYFKPWPHTSASWNAFLSENAGGIIGISIDGYITPLQIPYEFNPEYNQSGVTPEFVQDLTQDAEHAEALDLIYNSGVIPVEYTVTNSVDGFTQPIGLDYLELFLAIGVAIVIVMVYLRTVGNISTKQVLNYGITVAFLFALWIGSYKFTGAELDALYIVEASFLLLITATFVSISTAKRKSERLIFVVTVILIGALVAPGDVREKLLFVAIMTTVAGLVNWIVELCLDNLVKLLKK